MKDEEKKSCGCGRDKGEGEKKCNHKHDHEHGEVCCNRKHEHEHGEGCCNHKHEHEDGCCGEHDCDCGCEEPDIVELTDENGKVMKFYHIGTIEFKNAYYAAFQAAEEIEGVDEDELIIFEVADGEEEESELLPIEDQDLLDEVYEEFCRVLDEEDEEPEEEF